MTSFGSALIVDDDQTIRSYLEELLGEYGVTDVVTAADGQEAWETALGRTFDLIITDWKLPKVNGLTLVNRLRRSQQYPHVPIIVMSGFLGRKDFKLLDELPLTEKIEKPFSSSDFLDRVAAVEKEYKWQMEKKSQLTTLLESGESGGPNFIAKMIELLQEAPNPLPALLLGARLLFQRSDYAGAEQLMALAMRLRPNSTLAMFELGKIHIKQKRFREALPLLEKAQAMSPDNLSRLCLLGDVHLQEINPEKAAESFRMALRIDADDTAAKQGLQITQNLSHFLEQSPEQRLSGSFASMMNAVGISMVRRGKVDEGLSHYRSAMSYVDDRDARAKLAFNSALGCIRKKDFSGAKDWLNTALTLNHSYAKAELLVSRVEESMQKGTGKVDIPSEWQEGYDIINTNGDDAAGNDGGGDNAAAASLLPVAEASVAPVIPLIEPAKDPRLIRKTLLTHCPNAKEIFKMLTSDGVNSLSQMNDYDRLLEKYGAQMLDKAFLVAIKERNPKASYVESTLLQMAG